MKKNNKYFGILLNNRIPKTEKEKNKYYKNVRLKFEGKAFIVKNNSTIEKELKNGEILKKDGQYLIKFINNQNETSFINIEIKKIILILVLLLALIIFSLLYFFKFEPIFIDKQLIFDSLKYDYELKGDTFVFNINYGNNEYKKVELFDKMSNSSKIYPGSSGFFYIYINTLGGNKDINYKMEVEEELNKPQFLKYELNGKIYNSIKELSNDVVGNIKENNNKVIKINWFWEYESSHDIQDTNEGLSNNNYSFLMRMIGIENI